MSATSSSDRYAKAREALGAYDFAADYPDIAGYDNLMDALTELHCCAALTR